MELNKEDWMQVKTGSESMIRSAMLTLKTAELSLKLAEEELGNLENETGQVAGKSTKNKG